MLVAPIGFVSDHLEVLYDLDIEATSRGQGYGYDSWIESQMLNTRSTIYGDACGIGP